MAVGFVDLFAARMAMAVTGMSWMPLVLIARKVHIALVAVPGRGLSVSKSRIARSPSGVAALPKAEHVRGNVHQHRTHRGMFRRNFRENHPHEGARPCASATSRRAPPAA